MATPLFISAVLALGLVLSCDATTFTVGDSAGWDVSANLQSWVADKTFNVGDVLLFQYSRYQNVSEVDSAGYKSCNASNAMLTASSGNTSITLTSPGEKYFISGAPLYCFGGMSLAVKVQGGNAMAPASRPAPVPGMQSDTPPSISRPSNGGDNDLFPHVTGSGGGGGSCRSSIFEAWLCTIGALLWICFSGI